MGTDTGPTSIADRLRKVTTVYSHRSCPDGTAGAMVCIRAFATVGMDVDLKFIQYDEPAHTELKPAPGQLFVDITPPISRWREWEGFDPIVLDHHSTVREAVEGLGGVYGDSNQSGASLAYDHVMLPLIMSLPKSTLAAGDWSPYTTLWKEFARMAMLRDTWQEDHEDFREAQGMMRCLGFHGSKVLIQECRDGTEDLEGMFLLGKKLQENAVRKAELLALQAVSLPLSAVRLDVHHSFSPPPQIKAPWLRPVPERPGKEEPRPQRLVWTGQDDGLVSIQLDPSDAVTLTNLLKERVRRITWLEKAGTEEFLEVHRIARMCYEMADGDLHHDGFPTLSNLSREDVEILYALESHKVVWLTNSINAFRIGVRSAGPVGPVEADKVAKDFVTVMTG